MKFVTNQSPPQKKNPEYAIQASGTTKIYPKEKSNNENLHSITSRRKIDLYIL